LVLLLTAVTVVTVYYRGHGRTPVSDARSIAADVVDPIGRLVSAVVHPVEHFLQGAVDYGSLERANARLITENEQLRNQLRTSKLAEGEVDQLKQQLGLPYLQGMATVAADVVDLAPSNFESAVEIDRGSSSGVAVGMPVVSGGGLVGSVAEVSRSYSIVELVTDGASSVAVRFSSGSNGATDTAVALGQGPSNPLKVQYVNPHDQIARGEVMVTSGLSGGNFPPGIPVGKVQSVRAAAGTLELDVSLAPVVDLRSLEFVSVVEWEPAA